MRMNSIESPAQTSQSVFSGLIILERGSWSDWGEWLPGLSLEILQNMFDFNCGKKSFT